MKQLQLNKIIPKIIISIILLCCLIRMPYAYYQFTRISVFGLLCYLIYVYYQEKKMMILIPFILCAILFNPLVKISFNRHQWQNIDLIIGIAFIIWGIIEIALTLWFKKKDNVIEKNSLPHSPNTTKQNI